MKKLAVIGQGYVDLPRAVRTVEAGDDVVGMEVDQLRAERPAAGDSYLEDISSEARR